ncbi:MAG TPA: type II secretion system protein [Verrucomicrobiae bacterium]
MQTTERKIYLARSCFTLVELLTVIAIIAVLASLLLTAIASAKKKARMVTCTSNLHQFSLALNLYLEDSGGNRPTVAKLVSGNYLPSPGSLICPQDMTGNWGRLVETNGSVPAGSIQPTSNNFSYLLFPLSWDDTEWEKLVKAGEQAGVAACQLHGLGNQNNPNIFNYSGQLLRAQLDGSVARRQFFWSSSPAGGGGSFSGTNLISTNLLNSLQIFFDEPTNQAIYQ